MLAAAGAGLYPDLESAAQAMRGDLTAFNPAMDDDVRQERLTRWRAALAAA
jgi:glycerol kinase